MPDIGAWKNNVIRKLRMDIQHKTVSFKTDMLLILKFIFFHMMYGIIKCAVIMRYFPADDMNLVFSFIDQYFWSVLKFNKQLYILVETVIFSQQYFSTFLIVLYSFLSDEKTMFIRIPLSSRILLFLTNQSF